MVHFKNLISAGGGNGTRILNVEKIGVWSLVCISSAHPTLS